MRVTASTIILVGCIGVGNPIAQSYIKDEIEQVSYVRYDNKFDNYSNYIFNSPNYDFLDIEISYLDYVDYPEFFFIGVEVSLNINKIIPGRRPRDRLRYALEVKT